VEIGVDKLHRQLSGVRLRLRQNRARFWEERSRVGGYRTKIRPAATRDKEVQITFWSQVLQVMIVTG
jgi:hypothetical protein